MPSTLPVVVDRTSPVPLYHQLAEQWSQAIRSGQLKPGEPFENELALVARLRLSRPTVRKAMDELVRQGLLVRRRGVGTHVATQFVHRDNMTSLWGELTSTGRAPRTQVLQLMASRPNPEIATEMGLPAPTPLVYLERLRFSAGAPLVVLRSWLPPRFADLTEDECTTTGLRELLTRRGGVITRARQRARARLADQRERRLLELGRSGTVLAVRWQGLDASGQTIEYGEHSYRGDRFELDNTITA